MAVHLSTTEHRFSLASMPAASTSFSWARVKNYYLQSDSYLLMRLSHAPQARPEGAQFSRGLDLTTLRAQPFG